MAMEGFPGRCLVGLVSMRKPRDDDDHDHDHDGDDGDDDDDGNDFVDIDFINMIKNI